MRNVLFTLGLLGAAACSIGVKVCCATTATVASVQWDRKNPLTNYNVLALIGLLNRLTPTESSARFTKVLSDKLKEEYDRLKQSGSTAARNNKGEEIGQPNLEGFVEDLKSRYNPEATTIAELRDSIKQALSSARKGDLYEKLAKFVGRVNIGDKMTGTGTIIQWDRMDPRLKGRVVLTVAHNYYDSLKLCYVAEEEKKKWEAGDRQTEFKTVGDIDTIITTPHKNANLGTEENMSFMIDLSESEDDVVTYAPGTPGPNEEHDANHKVIKVNKIYCIGKNYVTAPFDEVKIPDVAIFILESPATCEGAKLGSAKFEEGKKYLSVGYGMASGFGGNCSYYEKYMSGWNTKKVTFKFTYEQTSGNAVRQYIEKDATEKGLKKSPYADPVAGGWNYPCGPSDSGSPIINENDNEIVAIVTGEASVITAELLNWIKAIGADFLSTQQK